MMNDAVRQFDDVSCDVPVLSDVAEVPFVDVYETAPILQRFEQHPFADTSLASVAIGLGGLALLMFFLGGAIPIELEWIEGTNLFNSRPVFWVMSSVMMLVLFPATAVSAFSIAVVMFWHVSLVARFIVAVAMFTPAVIALTIGIAWMEGGRMDEDLISAMCVLFSAAFASAASVGIFFQLATPWTLTHLRINEEELPRLGIRTLIELTTIVALTFAFASALNNDIPIEATLSFAGIAGLGALMGIISCLAFLRERPIGMTGLIGSFAGAFAMSFAFVGIIATAEYGWTSVIDQFYVTLPVSLFGAAIISASVAVCITWLRKCGWRCVR
ncbi:MAG: hypothetical protein WBD20_16870 [Pirellulaceae bacterium]